MSKTRSASAVALCVSLIAISQAQAQTATRAWVSGRGVDQAGCGAPAAPCRSLQYAHDSVVAAGGEIDILDPAGYGTLNITKSISIVNDGVGTAGVQGSTGFADAAIFVNAQPTDTVFLRGLSLEGLGTAQYGIWVNGAGHLTIDKCIVRHFLQDGVAIIPGANLWFTVLDTISADNGRHGFDIGASPAAGVTGLIDHTRAINNGWSGVNVDGEVSGYIDIGITNSNIANNGKDGVYGYSPSNNANNVLINVFESTSDFNGYNGYHADGWSQMQIARSEAMSNDGTSVTIAPNAIGRSAGDNARGAAGGTSGPLGALPSF